MTSKAFDNATDANRQQGGRRNLIINGAMQVAQRGTSVTGQTTPGYKTADRWFSSSSGSTFDQSVQTFSLGQTDVPGATHYLRHSVTTGNNNAGVFQKIENTTVQTLLNKTLTLSFYAKGTNPGGGSIEFYFGLYDLSNYSSGTAQYFSLNSDWTYYTITADVPDVGSVDLTNPSSYMEVLFLQPSSDTSTDAWVLDITQVQLEVGTVATPFEHRSYGEELALCQRYYYKHLDNPQDGNTHGGTGAFYSGSDGRYPVYPPVTMRTQPSLDYSGSFLLYSNGQNDSITTWSLTTGSNRIFQLQTTQGTASGGHAFFLYAPNSGSGYMAFEAEL